MMNKNDYIREVDNIHLPDEIKDKISEFGHAPVKNKPRKKHAGIIAACLAVSVLLSAAFGMSFYNTKSLSESSVSGSAKESEFNYSNNFSDTSNGTSIDQSTVTALSDRKITKNAVIEIETNDSTAVIEKLNEQIKKLNGYTVAFKQNDYDDYSVVSTDVCVPAEKLDEFLDYLSQTTTVKSKSVNTDDITDSYIDIESRITVLETEEKTLLGILQKCDTVADVISVQDRLSEVRADLESLKSQKEQYDSQITFSSVSITVKEVDRVSKPTTSFGSEIAEKFSQSLYNLGHFFRSLAVFILGASPYLIIAVLVIVTVVVIVKKKRK